MSAWKNAEIKTQKKLKDKNIKGKLNTSFKTIMVAFLITIVVAFIGMGAVIAQFAMFYSTYFKQDMLQMEVRKDVQMVGKYVLWSLNTMDDTEAKEYIAKAEECADNITENITELAAAMDSQETETALLTAFQELQTAQSEVLNEMNANDYEGALESFNTTYKAATETMEQYLVQIGEYTNNASEKTFTTSIVVGITADVVLILMMIACACISIFFEKVITKMLREPIDELETAAQKLKKGELDVEITYESKDELGRLSENFREACVQIREVVDDAGVMLEQMADGNFDIDSQAEDKYVGNFEVLLTSMQKMNSQLSITLGNIQESSAQVEIGAQQLSESAQALAEGATDQAASIEELTATVENVTAISEESAENAEKAAEGMSKAEADARGSRAEMQELTAAMDRISDTSKEIEEIIGAIEDIASQTNLLALNASIEAARAGEAGRGFAVVADQIGKLAADSAKSAVNTRDLISKSLAEIEHGNDITNKTSEAIDKVVENMTQFAAAAKGSAQASRSQADMLKQVEYGIEQISGVVQNNSATAQETSAVSEELLAQAETLKEQISQFSLRA